MNPIQNHSENMITQNMQENKGQIVFIPIEKLHPHPDNPRKDVGDVTELADSIRKNGVMQNLTVVPLTASLGKEFIVVIGHRRLAASKDAGLTELPCVIVDMDYKTQIATMLLENMQRKDLNIYEEASGMQMMLDLGDDVNDVAEQTGLSKTTVRRRVNLLRSLGDTGLRSVVGKQIDITDMERIAEIHDPLMREKAIAAAGTADFNFTMNQITRAQELDQIRTDLIAAAKLKFGGEPLKANPVQSEYHASFTFWNTGDIERFKRTEGREYCYMVSIPGVVPRISAYEMATDEERNAAALQAAKAWAEGREPKQYSDNSDSPAVTSDDPLPPTDTKNNIGSRLKELGELTQTAEQCRTDFIKNITASAAYPEKAMEFAVRMLLLVNPLTEEELLERFACDNITEIYKMMNGSRSLAMQILINSAALFAVHSIDCLDDYTDGFGYYATNDALDEFYEALGELGYEMSTEERQLADGTHPLYAGNGDVGDE